MSGTDGILVRINGVSSDRDDDKRDGNTARTSVSIFLRGFHLLIDAGDGVANSLNKSSGQIPPGSAYPDAILITNSKKQHIADIPMLIGKNNDKKSVKIYCTQECAKQVSQQLLPSLTNQDSLEFSHIKAGSRINIGPFSVLPVAANGSHSNTNNTPTLSDSIIYI